MDRSIEHLNADCACVTLDVEALCRAAEAVVGDAAFCRDLAATHPHLLSAQPLFLSPAHAAQMQRIIRAIETVARHPDYRRAVLAARARSAGSIPGRSACSWATIFISGRRGPKLIEINTNAGGALVNAYLLQAQRACCTEMADAAAMRPPPTTIIDAFMAAIASEWRRQGGALPLRSIAIVDQAPPTQYLYPEFVLFQRLFTARGLAAVIAAPEQLTHRDGALWHGGQRIDFVYNRLTDFDLSQPANAVLRSAYLAGDVVVSPNPHAHALFANKRNLALLSDGPVLRTGTCRRTWLRRCSTGSLGRNR